MLLLLLSLQPLNEDDLGGLDRSYEKPKYGEILQVSSSTLVELKLFFLFELLTPISLGTVNLSFIPSQFPTIKEKRLIITSFPGL